MKLVTLCAISAATFVGCTTPKGRQRQEVARHQQFLEQQAPLIAVNPSDGISEIEAYRIGKDRFAKYQTACGIVSTPVDLGDHWRVTTCPGIIGQPLEDILIRKSDGLTTIKEAAAWKVPMK